MDRMDISLELSKINTAGQGNEASIPHPESPVKKVTDLPSHHCEESDFQSHHRDHVSYHEPLQRRHHHRHRQHRQRHRRHSEKHAEQQSGDAALAGPGHGRDVAEVRQDGRGAAQATKPVPAQDAGQTAVPGHEESRPVPMQTTMFMTGSGSSLTGEEGVRSSAAGEQRSPHASPVKSARVAPRSPQKAAGVQKLPTLSEGLLQGPTLDTGKAAAAGPAPVPSSPATESRKERHHRRKRERESAKGDKAPGVHHHHHHHRHHRHHHPHSGHHGKPLLEDGNLPTEMDEAAALQGRDLEDMAAHRWAAPMRQSLMDPRAASIGDDGKKSPAPKQPAKEIDHSSHDMFVELEELQYGLGHQLQWRETARWVKYEEDVVEEADRWGKPHIASLSFHALLALRRCVEQGTVLLDLEKEDLPSIAAAIVDDMVATNQLSAQYREPILHALLLRHVHQSDPHEAKHETPARPSGLSLPFSSHIDTESPILGRHNSYTPLTRPSVDASSLGRQNSFAPPSRQNSFPPPPRSSMDASALGAFPMRQMSNLSYRSTTITDDAYPAAMPTSEETEADHDPNVDDDPGNTEPQHDPVAASFVSAPTVDVGAEERQPDGFFPMAMSRRNSFTMAINGSDAPTDMGVRDLSTLLEPFALTEDPHDRAASQHLPKEERHLLEHLPSGVEGTTVLVGSLDFLTAPVIAFVRLSEGRHLGHVTEVPIPVRFLFVMLGPPDFDFGGLGSMSYHEIGRSIATLMADKEVLEAIYSARQRTDILLAFDLFLDDSIVLPPGQWENKDKLDLKHKPLTERQKSRLLRQELPPKSPGDGDDPLSRTGRFCGGMIEDLGRLRKRWVSDFTDAGRVQVFFAALFMYFGALAPVITFGGLLGKKTSSAIGLSEMLLCTSVGGMIFSLLSSQPLMLIGPTGPLLVFEELIYDFCETYKLPFLQFRFWTGMWVFVILFVVVATDASLLVKNFTRFTEEVFAFLIGFIFIFESLKSILVSFKANPLKYDYCSLDQCFPVNFSDSNSTFGSAYVNANATCMSDPQYKIPKSPMNAPNAALVYMIMVFFTFLLAYALRLLRHSRYLGRDVRRTISDFGILITIVVAVLIAHFGFDGVELDFIKKAGFATSQDRSLVVNPVGDGMRVELAFGALIPALLVAFLAFVETQVTCLLVTNPDHRLVKGQGFHWNLLIVAVLIAFSSMLGLPWLTGTPVPSLSHTGSLLLYERTRAPGERPKVSGAIEQRVSNFAIHALLLVTLTSPIAATLQQVPISVLFGVFLYLGVVSLLGLQFSRRLVLLFVPTKHHPDDAVYVRTVRALQMHKYTIIQLLCLLSLIAVKLTPAAVVFPVIIFLMVPLRNYIVTRYFSERELEALDPHGEAHDDQDADSLDEFEAAHLPV